MKITEIITESQELEEGWKQKLAGAALAGAAALGGGGANDANAQTLNLPDAVWKQADRAMGFTNDEKTGNSSNFKIKDSKIAAGIFVDDWNKLYKEVYEYAKKVKANTESSEKVTHNYTKFKKEYDRLEKWYSTTSSLINQGLDRSDKEFVSGAKDITLRSIAVLNKFIEKNVPVEKNGREIETLSIAGIGEYVGEVDDKGQPSGKGTFTSKFGQKITGTWKNGEIRVNSKTESGEVSGTYDMYRGFTPDKNQASTQTTQPNTQPQASTQTTQPNTQPQANTQSSKSEIQNVSFTTKDGLTYSGEVKNGKPHGYGKLTYPKGVVVSGISYPMGRIESGIWENGRLIKQQ